MNIAPFWDRVFVDDEGKPYESGWRKNAVMGWSFVSKKEATEHAYKRGLEIFFNGLPISQRSNEYYGIDRPMREEILQQIPEQSPNLILTRNRYGATVLNCSNIMFVDSDRIEPVVPRRKWWQMFTNDKVLIRNKSSQALDNLRKAVEETPNIGLRIYETAMGYRGLVTSKFMDPDNAESIEFLEKACNDELYMLLCAVQGCYRARLTPKPWRIDWPLDPCLVYPYQNKSKLEQWLKGYEERCNNHSVCRFVEQIGNSKIHPKIAEVIELHDSYCLTGHPLA